MLRRSHLALFALCLWTALSAFARQAAAERFVVPLSEPSRPAAVEVSLIHGSITVEAYDGQDVIVETAVRDEAKAAPEAAAPRADGMRRIPNTSQGLTIEEEANHVEVSAPSWQRAVDMSLKVPARTSSLKLSTVHGGHIVVTGITGELELNNANGSVEATGISGAVVAQAVNGEIRIVFRQVTEGKPMAFSTVNGNIDVTFPANLKADLRMRSDQGEILTDFEFAGEQKNAVTEERDDGGYRLHIEKDVHGKLNGGGPEIRFKTFRGDILIRKHKG